MNDRLEIMMHLMTAQFPHIMHYGGDAIVRRNPETDEKITAEKAQDEEIAHYTKLTGKVADALIAAAGEGTSEIQSNSEPSSPKEAYMTFNMDVGCFVCDYCNQPIGVKPSVPSVDEISEVLQNACKIRGFPTVGSFSIALHQWLTERAKK